MIDTAVHLQINRAVGAWRGIEAPQILADQLTLSQPDGALCFEWGFTRTFPGNQDVEVK